MNDHDHDYDQQQPTNCASDMGFCGFQNLCDVIAPVSRHVHKGLNLDLWIVRDERDSESRLLLLRIMGPTLPATAAVFLVLCCTTAAATVAADVANS